MLRMPRTVFALVALVGLGSSGCVQTLQLVGASLELAGAIADASRASQASQPQPEDPAGADGRALSRYVDPSPERPMSECELARGQWRERHQDQDVPPLELRCLPDGAYPAPQQPPNAFVAPVDVDSLPAADAPKPKEPANPDML